ncbi:MAG: DNRLRE domain-containing protein [Opitutaceae bacterium]|nr:DNRLRE domain-containing protein [Cytophagales bacterium]
MKLKLLSLTILLGFNAYSQTKLTIRPGAEGNDAVIFSRADQTNVNGGSSVDLQAAAWTWNADQLGSGVMRSLIKFDLSKVPANATIVEATLTLYASNYDISGTPGHSKLTGSNSATLRPITQPWQENTVTWNNQPTTSAPNVIVTESNNGNQNYYLNVIKDVRNMLLNPSTNNGWMLQLDTETPYRGLFFASGDASDPLLHPMLEITYTLPCDGTKEIQPATEGIDALIFSRVDSKALNQGNSPYFHAATWSWDADQLGDGTYRSLLKFDLSSIPQNSIIESANLTLFADNYAISQNPGHNSLTHSNASKLYTVNQQWEESTVNWNNQPTFNTNNATVSLPQSTTGNQDYILDVKSSVQGMVANPLMNYGWMLKQDIETTYSGMFFASSDNANAALRPKLLLKYSCPVVTSFYETSVAPEGFAIFPNPIESGELFLTELSTGRIVDLKGNTVQNFTNSDKTDISSLSKGIYFVLTNTGISRKLVIK